MRPLTASDPGRVGHYRMLAELGRGGMGRVLLGSAPDGRLVAVKLVRDRLVRAPGFRDRFRHEVTATRTVSGAYTAAVIDADADAPVPWLAAVYVPAPSLRDAVEAAGPLPEQAVARLAAGLAAALLEIHRRRLVHCDLKPSNVLLAADGPKVIDFGVARAAEADRGGPAAGGPPAGTPAYMSPEQAEEGTPTTAGDVFSLGSTLVYACTGRGPFDAPGSAQALYNVVHADPDLSAVPARLRPVIAACLAKDPGGRPTPGRLAEMLGQVAPAARPWPLPVQRMIEERRAGTDRMLDRARQAETATVVDPPPGGARTGPRAALGTVRGRLAAGGMLVAAVAVAAVLVVAAAPWSEPSAGAGPRPSESTPPPVSRPLRGHTAVVTDVAFSSDGRTLASASRDATVRLWDVSSRTQRGAPLPHPEAVTALAIGPGDTTLYTAGSDGYLRVFPMSGDGDPGGTEIARAARIDEMVLSPDGRVLATDSMGGGVQLWDLDDGKVGPRLPTEGSVQALAFGPDGHRLAVGMTGPERPDDTTEGLAQMWDVDDREKFGKLLTGHGSRVTSVAFSPDGRTLAVAGGKTMRVWDVSTGRQVGEPFTCETGCRAVAFGPDGRTLAVGGVGGTARLWNVADHRRIGPDLTGHTGHLTSVEFSPDGRTLATGSFDGTVRLWPVPGAN